MAFVLPNVGNTIWNTPIEDPPLFAKGNEGSVVDEDDRVLTVPAWGANMRWQAEADFDFKLAAGYVGAFPRSYQRYPGWQMVLSGRLQPGYAAKLRRFVRDKGVTVILQDSRYHQPWSKLFGTLGVPPRRVGGMLVYRLRPR